MFKAIFGGAKRPATASVQVLPLDVTFTVDAKQTVLAAALEQNIPYPHYCRVGSCGTCKTKLVSGRVRELTDKSYTLSAAEIADGVILACQAVPKTDLVLENRRLFKRQGAAERVVLPPG